MSMTFLMKLDKKPFLFKEYQTVMRSFSLYDILRRSSGLDLD